MGINNPWETFLSAAHNVQLTLTQQNAALSVQRTHARLTDPPLFQPLAPPFIQIFY